MNTTAPLTILLVEDHDDSREAIKSWLEWKGYRVFTANDQESGLALARVHPIDLLICDLQLPDGNGWELMEKVQENKPVCGIITSGHCSGADIARSKAVGYLEHLVKPYPVEELDAWLVRVQERIKKQDGVPADPGSKTRKRPEKAGGR